jgi:hypothetical protein
VESIFNPIISNWMHQKESKGYKMEDKQELNQIESFADLFAKQV